jgi:predicted HicB family RNase H-like nuclease
MNYKGYEAKIEFEEEDRVFVGKVINIKDKIIFEGLTVDELEESFHTAIDSYLDGCKMLGVSPDMPLATSKIN